MLRGVLDGPSPDEAAARQHARAHPRARRPDARPSTSSRTTPQTAARLAERRVVGAAPRPRRCRAGSLARWRTGAGPRAGCGRWCRRCCAPRRSSGCCSPGRCCRSSATASCSWRCPSRCSRPAAASRRSGSSSPRSSCPSSCSRSPAASISDRGDRRRVLIASDVARLVVQAVGGILLVTGAATPLMLGVLAAFYGTADAFFQPAFTGLLPQTVSHPGQLQPANALRGLSFSISSIAGPALAGVLIAGLGAGAAMLFDAGSFAVSVACLLRLAPARGGRGDRGGAARVPRRDQGRLARGAQPLVGARRPRRHVRLRGHRAARRLRARPGHDRRPPRRSRRLGRRRGLLRPGLRARRPAAAAHPPSPRAADGGDRAHPGLEPGGGLRRRGWGWRRRARCSS